MWAQGDLETEAIATNCKNFVTPSTTQFSVNITLKARESNQKF